MDQLMNASPLLPYLKQFSRRLRLRDGWLAAQRTLWLAGVVSILILLVGRLFPIEDLYRWALLPPVAWLVLVLGYALFYPAVSYARGTASG